jgi:hypothetical protein
LSPLDSVWYRHKAVSLWREIIGIARCEFQFVIFRNCGLQCIRHLPAILPPQGSWGQLPLLTLKPVRTSARVITEIVSCPCISRRYSVAADIPLKWSIMITESTRTVGIYFCHSFRKRVDTSDHRPVSKFRSFVPRDLSEEGPHAFSHRGIFELLCVINSAVEMFSSVLVGPTIFCFLRRG